MSYVVLSDRWSGSMREPWSSDWVTCCVKDPEDQVGTDYYHLKKSSLLKCLYIYMKDVSKQLN